MARGAAAGTRQMMSVSDRDREGISGIGTGDCRAREQALNHGMDLDLLGRAATDQ